MVYRLLSLVIISTVIVCIIFYSNEYTIVSGSVTSDERAKLAGRVLDTSEGVFSDLEIIFCNRTYNPCNGTDEVDYMRGDQGKNTIVGMKGNDNITANGGDDEIWGNEGNDLISGGNGIDHMSGQDGNDILHGELNDDVIVGGEGNDYIYGGYPGADDDDDILVGGTGADRMFAGSGNDKVFQNIHTGVKVSVKDGSKDLINCGPGHDEVWINVLDKDSAIYCEVIHKSSTTSKIP